MLGREEILRLIREGGIAIEPISPDTVRENGVDLRLGYEVCRLRMSGIVDTRKNSIPEGNYTCHEVSDEKGFIISPGERVLVSTYEKITLHNIAAIITLRSTAARLGLTIPPTVVDSGFSGVLTIAVTGSAFPVRLYPRQRLFHLVLFKVDGASAYNGSYSGRKGIVLPRLPL